MEVWPFDLTIYRIVTIYIKYSALLLRSTYIFRFYLFKFKCTIIVTCDQS